MNIKNLLKYKNFRISIQKSFLCFENNQAIKKISFKKVKNFISQNF